MTGTGRGLRLAAVLSAITPAGCMGAYSGGMGVSYLERRGRNHLYAEARWHRIIDGDRSAHYAIPLSVGVLF